MKISRIALEITFDCLPFDSLQLSELSPDHIAIH